MTTALTSNQKKTFYSPTSSSVGFLVSTQRKAALQPEEPLPSLCSSLEKTCGYGNVNLTIKGLLLAHKVRKVYYTPLSSQAIVRKQTGKSPNGLTFWFSNSDKRCWTKGIFQ